jgi:hypothetical protein
MTKLLKNRWAAIGVSVTLLVCVLAAGVGLAIEEDLETLLKLFGIGYVVTLLDDELNGFINDLLHTKNVACREMTKVVPIVSIGSGKYVGAAQVTGAKEKLSKVKAVAQGELSTRPLRDYDVRLKVLLPVETSNAWEGIKGVSGVEVSAIIDFRS